MVYELYWISGSPYAWAVMLGLEIKELAYQSNRLDPSKGEHKSEHYLAMNPHGKVPVLKDNESNTVVYESLAILAYLDSKHPSTPLFGRNPQETALIWQRIFEFLNYQMPSLNSGIIQPLRRGETVDKTQGAKVHETLSWIESLLADAPYLTGQFISAADVVLTPFMQILIRELCKPEVSLLNLELHAYGNIYPHMAGWVKRIEAIPGYDTAYPVHWRNQ